MICGTTKMGSLWNEATAGMQGDHSTEWDRTKQQVQLNKNKNIHRQATLKKWSASLYIKLPSLRHLSFRLKAFTVRWYGLYFAFQMNEMSERTTECVLHHSSFQQNDFPLAASKRFASQTDAAETLLAIENLRFLLSAKCICIWLILRDAMNAFSPPHSLHFRFLICECVRTKLTEGNSEKTKNDLFLFMMMALHISC